MNTGIIGTAGRDKTKPMTLNLWRWMIRDVRERIEKGDDATSGGAAWADHLAVSLLLFGWIEHLTLFLPAPFENGRFVEMGYKSAGGTANYYHRLFSKAIERDTLGQLAMAIERDNVTVHYEPASPGIGGMFARNAKVAMVPRLLAYTFGEGDEPADGGTKDTWDKCEGERIHVPLPILY